MQSHTVTGWLVGLVGVSLVLGSICSYLVSMLLRRLFDHTARTRNWQLPAAETERVPFQRVLIGLIERLFFTILVAFNVPGVAAGLATWILVKMLTGWNRVAGEPAAWRRMLAFNGLINSLVSLLFAVLGGLIANGTIRWWCD